jgi:hypothetical protein
VPPNNQQGVPSQGQAPMPNLAAPVFNTPNSAVQSGQKQQASGSGATPTKPPVTTQSTTQKSLLFSEIRDNMLIMADGSFRSVIACESINFDLMSNREREGIEFSYQNFLNSLNFDIQIFIRSQRVDIAPYLNKLEAIRRSQDNMLLGVMMDDYMSFVSALAEEANIMDKSFYIVVPYSPNITGERIVEKSKGFFGQFLPKTAANVTKIDDATYQKSREEISSRVESVISGLFQIGIRCAQLTTKELGELYYNVYNPDTAVNQPLGNFEASTATYVRKGQGQVTPQNLVQGGM